MDSKTARRRLKRKDNAEEAQNEASDTLMVTIINKENQDPLDNISNQSAPLVSQDLEPEIDTIKQQKPERRLKRLKFIEYTESLSTQESLPEPQEESLNNILSKSIYTAEEDDFQYTANQEPAVSSDEDSSSEPKKAKGKKKKVAKNKGPKLVIFNKLLDPNIFTAEENVVTEREFLREDSLTLPSRDKTNFTIDRLMQRFQTKQPDKVISHLAKNVLKTDEHSDSLVIEKPDIVTGFRVKKQATNSRDMLRDALRSTIMERKTSHIDISRVFDKTKTELEGLKKKQEEEDSEYNPDKEDLEEQELTDLLDLDKQENTEQDQTEPKSDNIEVKENEDKISVADEIDELIGLDELSAQSSENEAEDSDSSMEAESSESDTLHIDENSCQSTVSRLSLSSASSTESESSRLLVKHIIEPKRKQNIFIDDEAELGSDHEENDERVKKVYDDESSLDGDLEELIDNEVVDTEEKQLADKYMGEQLAQDIFQLKKVINGEFVRKRIADDYIDDNEDISYKKAKLMKARAEELQGEFSRRSRTRDTDMQERQYSSDEDSEGDLASYRSQSRLIREISRTEQPDFRFFTASTYDPWFENVKH
jgi:hypothetical protein